LIDELVDNYNLTPEKQKEPNGSLDFIINLLHPSQEKRLAIKLFNLVTKGLWCFQIFLRFSAATALFEFIVTLETIVKVSIIAKCMGCNSQLLNKRCNFVGCHLVISLRFSAFLFLK
jgi:hypothetical protein